LAYESHVGSFNIDSSVTAGNDQSITGVGFQPKIVLFWWSGSTASADSVAGGTISFGFGAGISSTSRFCVVGYSEDGQATSDSSAYHEVNSCIRIYTDTATLDGLADFKSLDADGFTLTIDNQFSADYRISYLALGGDDLTNVYIGNKQRDNDTGNCAVTGVGFQPEAVIVASAWWTASVGENYIPCLMWAMGMATGSSNQGTVGCSSQDNQATSNTAGYGYNGETLSACRYDGVTIRDAFVSFDADGFTLNQIEGTGIFYYHYICLKGGQYAVGDLTTRTDGNDIEEDVGFEPVAVLFASANRALSTQDTVTAHARISIGAGTSTTNRAVQAISDEDNLADTETAYTNQDDAVYAHVVDDAVVGLMDIKSIDADGFTCVMDDAESSACWVTYLAIGAEAAGGANYDVSLTLARTATLTPSASAAALGSTTLGRTAGIIHGGLAAAIAAASLARSAGVSEAASKGTAAIFSLSRQAGLTGSGTAAALASATLARQAAISQSGRAAAGAGVSLSRAAGLTDGGQAAAGASLQLDILKVVTQAAVAAAIADATLASERGISQSATAAAAASFTTAIYEAVGFATGITASLALSRSMAMGLAATAAASANAALGRELGITLAGQAAALGDVSLGRVLAVAASALAAASATIAVARSLGASFVGMEGEAAAAAIALTLQSRDLSLTLQERSLALTLISRALGLTLSERD